MGVVSNFPMSNLSTLLFNLFEALGTFTNLSISNYPQILNELNQSFY